MKNFHTATEANGCGDSRFICSGAFCSGILPWNYFTQNAPLHAWRGASVTRWLKPTAIEFVKTTYNHVIVKELTFIFEFDFMEFPAVTEASVLLAEAKRQLMSKLSSTTEQGSM